MARLDPHMLTPQTEPTVAVHGLTKRFAARVAVDDVSLEVRPGEIVGFVGPNGAGKTTALRMLAGLIKPDGGEGRILGHDLKTASREIARRVGYMPQKLALYGDLSVADNLKFRAEVYELADARGAVAASLRDFELEERAGQRANDLSGGWGRRLQLAATLIHQPALVLLDEPTAGLDARSRQDVWSRIVALSWRGVSIVINTHDLLEAEQCGRVALFSAGAIVAFDTPEVIARSVPIRTVFIEGVDAARAGPAFSALAGVVCAYPQGRRLKLLVRPGAVPAVAGVAADLGAGLAEAPTRLEEAALALSLGVNPTGQLS
jgi:ABC-2 type transport system ATP-binding protein